MTIWLVDLEAVETRSTKQWKLNILKLSELRITMSQLVEEIRPRLLRPGHLTLVEQMFTRVNS